MSVGSAVATSKNAVPWIGVVKVPTTVNGCWRSFASSAAQRRASRECSDPSTPTTIPPMFHLLLCRERPIDSVQTVPDALYGRFGVLGPPGVEAGESASS